MSTKKLSALVRVDGEYVQRTVRLEREIGLGGMSTVYLGIDETDGAQYAVKILDASATRLRSGGGSTTFLDRFRQEMRLLSETDDPHLVEYRGYGRDVDEEYFYLTTFIDGKDLGSRLIDRARERDCLVENETGEFRFRAPEEISGFTSEEMFFGVDEIDSMARDVLAGLAYLHGLPEQIVHRDMKPENVLQGSDKKHKIIDLGISKILSSAETMGAKHLTATGVVMGTPAYLSPEQVMDSSRVTVHSDIFSFGVILFEMMTGLRLGADLRMSQIGMIIQRRVTTLFYDPAVYVRNVPERLRQAVIKATQLKPSDRFADAREMYDFLFPAKVEEVQAPVSASAPTPTPVPPSPTISRIPTVLATPTECARMVKPGGAPSLSTPPSVPVVRPAPTTIMPNSTRVFVSPSKAPAVPAMVSQNQKEGGSFLGTIVVIALAVMIIVLGGVLIFNKGDVAASKEDVTSGLQLLGSGVATAKAVVEQVTTAMTSDESPVPLPEAPAQRFDFSSPSSSAPPSPLPASPLGDKVTENVPAVGDTIASLKAEERSASTASEFGDLAKRYAALGDTSSSKRCASVAKALRNPRHSR